MSRRGLTFVVAGFLTAVLAVLATVMPVPYVVLVPGPVTDTLGNVPGGDEPLVTVKGAPTYDVDGHLYLTTVGVVPGDCDDHPTLLQALRAWFDRTEAVQPHQVICPPDKSAEDVDKENQLQMTLSQRDAITAALFELGRKPVEQHVLVQEIAADSPAAKVLQGGDAIVEIDGTAVQTVEDIRSAITAHSPGETVAMTIERDGSKRDVTVGTVDAKDGSHRPVVGITAFSRQATFRGIKVSIGVNPEDVGGPSAGLAFALAIVDRMTDGELTGGRTVASTGTIDGFGKVGPIGGIQQKIAGAKQAGATVFLVPAEDCADAVDVAPSSMTLVRVSTLHEAVTSLSAVVEGSDDFTRC
jgi:PDZ domain-containing protein